MSKMCYTVPRLLHHSSLSPPFILQVSLHPHNQPFQHRVTQPLTSLWLDSVDRQIITWQSCDERRMVVMNGFRGNFRPGVALTTSVTVTSHENRKKTSPYTGGGTWGISTALLCHIYHFTGTFKRSWMSSVILNQMWHNLAKRYISSDL